MGEILLLTPILNIESMEIIWAIALLIFIIINICIVASKRERDEFESFGRNFKIGVARTLGAITILYFLYTVFITIIYFLK